MLLTFVYNILHLDQFDHNFKVLNFNYITLKKHEIVSNQLYSNIDDPYV